MAPGATTGRRFELALPMLNEEGRLIQDATATKSERFHFANSFDSNLGLLGVPWLMRAGQRIQQGGLIPERLYREIPSRPTTTSPRSSSAAASPISAKWSNQVVASAQARTTRAGWSR